MSIKPTLKTVLGDLPFAPEAYWLLRQPGRPIDVRFSLDRLARLIPGWVAQVKDSPLRAQPGKRILLFCTLRYWVEYNLLLGLALAGQGHAVTVAFLPYADWKRPHDRFDMRRQNIYALGVLRKAEPFVKVVSFLSPRTSQPLPEALSAAVQDNAWRDTQYSLQIEAVDQSSGLYQLRLERDTAVSQAALNWMKAHRPDLVIVPNGSILEFGAVAQVALHLEIPVVSYEFGEQRQRVWMDHDRDVMRQETGDLWQARKHLALSEAQKEQVRTLFSSRQKASLWENFARRWQGVPSAGGQKVRAELGLDQRPVVLLATNVIGDSLTLGRQVFSESMTEWLERTARYFAGRPDVQFVARIHPGELITKGPSVADVVREVLPELPENIHLVPANARINTYDLVELADLGLVYTTTVGLEMAMTGVPVVVSGKTHYRGKGFTIDPESWEDYFNCLDEAFKDEPVRLTSEQVELAWNYAYRFFFEYPHPFPWHLLHIWNDLEEWPLKRVFAEEGQSQFSQTFRYLTGEPVDWNQRS